MWTTLPILCQEFQDVCKFNDRLVSNWGARRNADASPKWVRMVIPTFYPAFIRFQFFKFLQKFIFGSNLLAAGQVDLRMSLQCLELLSPCSWARNAPRSLNHPVCTKKVKVLHIRHIRWLTLQCLRKPSSQHCLRNCSTTPSWFYQLQLVVCWNMQAMRLSFD